MAVEPPRKKKSSTDLHYGMSVRLVRTLSVPKRAPAKLIVTFVQQ